MFSKKQSANKYSAATEKRKDIKKPVANSFMAAVIDCRVNHQKQRHYYYGKESPQRKHMQIVMGEEIHKTQPPWCNYLPSTYELNKITSLNDMRKANGDNNTLMPPLDKIVDGSDS